MDPQHPLGRLAFAVQCRCRKFDDCLFVRNNPIFGCEVDIESGVANVDRFCGCASFTSAIGDIRDNREVKCGLVAFRNGAIRLGNEVDGEGTVDFGGGPAVRYLLRLPDRRWHSPRKTTHKPNRPSDFARDAIADFGSVDGGSSVRSCFAGDTHIATQLGRFFRSVNTDLEFGAFVFLDTDDDVSNFASADRHLPGASIARCGETAAERSVVIGFQLEIGDFLAVKVAEGNGYIACSSHDILVDTWGRNKRYALEMNGLPWSINCPIRKKDMLHIHVLFNRLRIDRMF